jgi:hypothetical protein
VWRCGHLQIPPTNIHIKNIELVSNVSPTYFYIDISLYILVSNKFYKKFIILDIYRRDYRLNKKAPIFIEIDESKGSARNS